jgi:hypothetical protein
VEKLLLAGRGSKSLSPSRGEVWREVLYLIMPSYLNIENFIDIKIIYGC